MKQLDSDTTRVLEIPSVVLMERAALSAVKAIRDAGFPLSNVIVLAGEGNNGGDGVCVARILKEQGIPSDIFVIGKPSDGSECAHQIRTALRYDIPVSYGNASDAVCFLKNHACTLLIDAIFGVGLNRGLGEDYVKLIRHINAADCNVVSIDIPSGVDATTGKVLNEAVRSDLTVTFGYYKTGQFLYPGASYCGSLILDTIGILQDTPPDPEDLYMLEPDDLRSIKRDPDSHKGTFGKILLIAGSEETGGAAALCAMSAFRSGSGMVRIFTHENNRDMLLEHIPEAMVTTYSDDISGLKDAFGWADVIGIGPGISYSDTARRILRSVFLDCGLPLVLDADALHILKSEPELMGAAAGVNRTVIITPHLKEFSDLSGINVSSIKEDKIRICRTYAKEHQLICVLKDARTVISDGKMTVLNTSGNSGMATAGSGDVLLGLITSLLGQGLDGLSAAAYGCYIHGLAGDEAASDHGQAGMVASDMIGHFKHFLE